MMSVLNNRVAIVTGAGKGIGAAIAMELAKKGAHIIVNYNRSAGSAEMVVSEIKKMGGEAHMIQADISNLNEAEHLITETINQYGRLDILVNNAGITRDSTFKKLTENDWKTVIDVNLNSIFNTSSVALPYLLESDAGRIINISSIIGQSGGFGQTNYAAAKAGIIGYTKSLALELAKGNVTVNAICPGYIDTEMVQEIPDNVREALINKIPARRLGQPEDIARGVAYLCEDGGYITGQQLNINGGLYM